MPNRLSYGYGLELENRPLPNYEDVGIDRCSFSGWVVRALDHMDSLMCLLEPV